jgi:predicted kinase
MHVIDENEVSADVQKLRQGLNALPEPVASPVLVMVSGLPGTGKSHFSRRLAQRLPSVILESDSLRKTLFLVPSYSAQESQRLFSACHRLIAELLRNGVTVIFDATNLVEQHRERLYRVCDSLQVKLIIVQVKAPGDVVRQRLQDRRGAAGTEDHSEADWSVYQRMRSRVEAIRRNHFAVDTSRDIGPVIDKIIRAAKR